jgi:homoserine O-acetyltransferase/O-succinyltransferase
MTATALTPVTDGARTTHPVTRLTGLLLESGQQAPEFDAHATLHVPAGPPARVVIVCPALTGTHRVGLDWWTSVVAPLGAIDLQRDLVLCVGNLGATDGRDPWRGEATDLTFTVRDQAAIVERVRTALQLPSPTLVVGGSLGGMVALELAAQYGAGVHAVILGAPAAQTAWARALNAVQLDALRVAGDVEGLRLARAIGVLSYRTPREFEARWGVAGSERRPGVDGASYLRAHGDRLLNRFDAALYRRLVTIMDSHDVTRDRGTLTLALRGAAVHAVALEDDLLYPPADVAAWAQAIGAPLTTIRTVHGHDAFLLHEGDVAAILRAPQTAATR